ncbi:MAG: hypothetical protein DRP96_06705 [Candidatus Neomarinimicrobiota bacterium]|nr:MAG: hypothetical protein DRP96_06705 [Candidatus Neomarinimicrobiota bacterium]
MESDEMIQIKAPYNAGLFKQMALLRLVVFSLVVESIVLNAGEVLVLSDNVGAEIDVIEKVHYRLFTDINNFKSAQFYLLPNDSVMAYIESWDADGPVYYQRYYSLYEFYLLGEEISKKDSPDQAEIEFIQHKYKPLFAEDLLRQLNRNHYCLIILNNKQVYQGLFLKYYDRMIRILDNDQFYDIAIRSIRTLKYWDNTKQMRILQWITIGSGVAIGFGAGQVINFVFNIPAKQTGILPFAGMIAGGVLGYEAAPFVVEKLRPKTVIEFRKSKIKRLDSIGRLTYTFKKLKGKIWRTRAEQD